MSESTPILYQCATCRRGSINPRNLVVFIDGTSNKPGGKNTNVFKLFSAIVSRTAGGPEVEQRKYYRKGIGAHYTGHLSPLSRVRKGISSSFDMAFARNVGENVREAYGWLVDTYQEGDRIYLFGFSRGAYQVRALASMIHEVGLAKEKDDCEIAYDHYLSVDFYKPQRRSSVIQFRTAFCWPSVRIHFIGVWDTVSSLGLVKKDVHVTASASVTNACHFRHALSLDELRVKFMPEYFGEMNAHHSNIRSSRLAVSNVKEVWFAGSHSDVGGINRERNPNSMVHYGGGDLESCIGHAGNVSLEWMRKEAAASGLIFTSNEIAWDPQDVDRGTTESMTPWWKALEIFPIRHQVSFSGTGDHKWRWHLCRPRSIIPSQGIHPSVFSADIYTPRATLGNSPRNSIILRKPSDLSLDTTAPLGERARKWLLELLLKDQQATLGSLEKVLFLVDSLEYRCPEDERTRAKPRPQWKLSDIRGGPFTKYALTVIYDATSNVSISGTLLKDARDKLCTVLEYPLDHTEFTRTLYVLRFSAKDTRLRRHFFDGYVTKALIIVLERTSRCSDEIQFPLVMDSLCYLIADDHLRDGVVNQLFYALRDGAAITPAMILDVKAPAHLMASLKMVACLAKYHDHSDLQNIFESKLRSLAKKKGDGVGFAAVNALVAMGAKFTCGIHICNTLGYLDVVLPPLDVEVNNPLSPDDTDGSHLLTVGWVIDNGELTNQELMYQLVSTIKSRNVHERMQATLTLVKLCKNANVREFCTKNDVVDIFVKQLRQKNTSLLAAYALMKCWEYEMYTFEYNLSVAPALVCMVEKNWFDDAIGRVEGCKIFRGLMASVNLREKVIKADIVPILMKKLASGERNQTRVSLICIDVLDEESPLDLNYNVEEYITYLRDKDKDVRMKGVKVISALAQTLAGERAIKKRLKDIIKMLPEESSDSQALSCSEVVGAIAVLYNLSKNETLREHILRSPEFTDWMDRRNSRR